MCSESPFFHKESRGIRFKPGNISRILAASRGQATKKLQRITRWTTRSSSVIDRGTIAKDATNPFFHMQPEAKRREITSKITKARSLESLLLPAPLKPISPHFASWLTVGLVDWAVVEILPDPALAQLNSYGLTIHSDPSSPRAKPFDAWRAAFRPRIHENTKKLAPSIASTQKYPCRFAKDG
ncbi:hypothetical protein ACJ73_03667 [Blastomyces percursus]|uniref:Uncharacterized protein n=1 Tax=Blastomyces percursus TaxID=1658174 RepID=A0A1J9Q918_9EURO|nr:hypothetical protein ACJ73_03667 [Blastomyces percursus]